jgi:hypothetical protein
MTKYLETERNLVLSGRNSGYLAVSCSLYSRCRRFESGTELFVLDECRDSTPNRVLPSAFRLVIHESSQHSTLYSLRYKCRKNVQTVANRWKVNWSKIMLTAVIIKAALLKVRTQVNNKVILNCNITTSIEMCRIWKWTLFGNSGIHLPFLVLSIELNFSLGSMQ